MIVYVVVEDDYPQVRLIRAVFSDPTLAEEWADEQEAKLMQTRPKVIMNVIPFDLDHPPP